MNQELSPIHENLFNAESKDILREIQCLGDEEKVSQTISKLRAHQEVMRGTITLYPDIYGVTVTTTPDDAFNTHYPQQELLFLKDELARLRRSLGYIQIFGKWVHRSIVAFMVFSIGASFAGSVLIFLLFASTAWTWLYAASGLVVLIILWVLILKRVHN